MAPKHSPSNETIARAALAFIDENGIEAISFRKIAEATGIPTMTICNRFGSKDALLRAALKAMLDEFPIEAVEGECWQESLRRVSRTHRAMACAHPKAFPLFVEVPPFEEPVLTHSLSVFSTNENQGLPEGMPFVFLSIMHSFLSGFQLVESYAEAADKKGMSAEALRFIALFDEDAFERDLDIIIAGLEARYDLP